MWRSILLASLGLALALGPAGCGFKPVRSDGFVLAELAQQQTYVSLPADWTADKQWPVIVFLHGADERGANPVAPTQEGIGEEVHRRHGSFPFVVIYPQLPSGSFWALKPARERVIAQLDAAMAKYHGDPKRVYLTGVSMGGYGTWLIGGAYADRFAALVPICGGVRPPRGGALPADAPFHDQKDPFGEVARAIGTLPVWAFHGEKDWLVDVHESRLMIEALRKNGRTDVKYTEYPGVGHNAWDRAYATPELYTWLAAQHRD